MTVLGILRTPGTYNYKLGKDNAPLCHVVEVNDVRFTPEQLDEKLNSLYVEKKPESKPTYSVDFADDNPELKEFRIRRMLDFISVVDGEYEKWLSVGMALKNEDLACSLWENWSRTQPEYKEGECESKWQGFNRPGYGIGTLYQYAVEGGYDETETRREWKNKLQRVASCAKINSAIKRLAKDDSSQFRYITPERSCFSMGVSNDNTNAKSLQDLMTTREVADYLGVTVSTVKNWRQRKLFGCYFFPADKKHGDTWYYYRERVEQLKSVYNFGVLQNMHKLAKRNPEPTPPDDFQKSDSSRGQEELSFRHKEFLILDEVADYFGVSVEAVKKWHQRGILKEDMLGHNGDLYFAIDNVLEFVPPSERDSKIDSLKAELRKIKKALAEFTIEKDKALEHLSGVETFDNETIFSEDIVTAAAFARLFDSKAFSSFKGSITLFNQKTKEKKTSVNDWLRAVKEKAGEIDARHKALLSRKNEIQTQISSLSFVAEHDLLKGLAFPIGYNVSAQNGITKIDGEKIITVCRRPIVITEKTYNIEDKILKLKLAHMNTTGKQSAAIIFNSRKLVDLAEQGLPVTSSNATALVDFLDAFNVQNETVFPMTYSVSRGGWYTFDDKDYFVDPRCELSVNKDDKKIRLKLIRKANSFKP